MISASIHNISRAEAEQHEGGGFTGPFDTVNLFGQGAGIMSRITLYLPAGTGAAVAACINVAVGAGAQAEKAKTVAALKAKWNGICEAMNRGSWHGSEADALDQIESIKAQIAKLEAAA